MAAQTRRKWPIAVAAVALVVVAVLVSLYCSWNTNIRGGDSFCGGRMESGEVQAALDSTGRVAQVYASVDPQRPTFSCTVQRTSRFIGGEDQQVAVRTGFEKGAFPFTTYAWSNPASRSYFTGGVTGAVSEDFGGYVVLPKPCLAKLSNGGGDHSLAIVAAEVEKGKVDAAGLARLLSSSARQVAEKAGCDTAALSESPGLSAPSALRSTDVQNVCGVKGFALPQEALVVSKAELGQEQVNDGSADTWACDLHLAGSAKGAMSFSVTSDKNFTEAAMKARSNSETLPGGSGFARYDEAVLPCADGDVHFATKYNTWYDGALRDNGIRWIENIEVHKATFQNFLDASAAARSCQPVTIHWSKDYS